MEPIQPVQLGGPSNLGGITNVARMPSGAGQLQRVTNVSMAVSTMLQSIGGGVENNEMLKALIALMIIAALLQETMQGSGSSPQGLRTLNSGRGDAVQGMVMNATVSIEYTSVTINSTSLNQSAGGLDDAGLLGSRLDVAS